MFPHFAELGRENIRVNFSTQIPKNKGDPKFTDGSTRYGVHESVLGHGVTRVGAPSLNKHLHFLLAVLA